MFECSSSAQDRMRIKSLACRHVGNPVSNFQEPGISNCLSQHSVP